MRIQYVHRRVLEDAEDAIEIAQGIERARRVVGRQRPRLDAPVQVSDEIEHGAQRRRDVEVVVKGRGECAARSHQRAFELGVARAVLVVRLEGEDDRVEPRQSSGRSG